MPAISSSDKVLVTGANGYIALWIVQTLLERGNSVRAAVRSEKKGSHLKELFKSYGTKIETVVVPDMTKVSPDESRRSRNWHLMIITERSLG